MKHTFFILMSLAFSLLSFGQTPELSEIRFRLHNEQGQLLTCDSLQADTLYIIERGHLNSYEYDSITNFHTITIITFGSNFSIHWVRNEKVMDIIFNIYDTTNMSIDHYSFDKVKFEEGQYEIKVRTNVTPKCETFELSRSKYFQNIEVFIQNGAQHFNWDSLKEFKTNPSDWCSVFHYPLDDRTLKKVKCR